QRRALARAVRADDADGLAARDVERHLRERVEPAAPLVARPGPERSAEEVAHRVLVAAAREALRDAVEPNRPVGHPRSAKRVSQRANSRKPRTRIASAHAAPTTKCAGFEKPPKSSTSR